MKKTIDVIDTVLQVTNRGGRMFARDDETIILTDYDGLSNHALQRIEEQCPQWSVDIVQADVSSSGFVVMFTKTEHKAIWQSSACMQIFLLLLFLTCVILHLHKQSST